MILRPRWPGRGDHTWLGTVKATRGGVKGRRRRLNPFLVLGMACLVGTWNLLKPSRLAERGLHELRPSTQSVTPIWAGQLTTTSRRPSLAPREIAQTVMLEK